MKIEFNVDDLTLGEAEDLEEYLGMGLDEIGAALKGGQASTKMVTALVWIAKRKEEPAFTLAQARNVKVAELEFDTVQPANRATRRARPNAVAARRK